MAGLDDVWRILGVNTSDPFGLTPRPRAGGITETILPRLPGMTPPGPVAPSATLDRYADAITGIESGGRYDLRGPVTRSGDRAYGRYQVMGANIPTWTREALGRSLTPEEFLADRNAQDAVFRHRFGGYVERFGNPVDAAQAWFAGPGSVGASGAGSRSDATAGHRGLTVDQYRARFSSALNGAGPSPTPPERRNPMAGPLDFLFGSRAGQGAAATGSPDMLDLLGIGTQGRREHASNAAAMERVQAQIGANRTTAAGEGMALRARQDAMRALTSRFQAMLGETSGDVSQALSRLIRDPAFTEAFSLSPDGVQTFLTQVKGLADPSSALRAELEGGGRVMQDRSADAGLAPDPAAMPGVGPFGNLTPGQREAALAATRIAPQATVTAAGNALASQAFPPPATPGQPFTLRPADRRYDANGRLIAEAPDRVRPDPAMAREVGRRIGAVSTAGDVSREMIGQIGALRSSLAGVDGTSFFTRLAAHYGVPTQNTDVETFRAILARIAPQMRIPGTGATSDKDLQTFFNSLPNLLQSAAGRKQIIDTMEAVARDAAERGDIADRALSGEITPQEAFNLLRERRNPFNAEQLEDMSDTDLRKLAENEAAMADPRQRARVIEEVRRRRDAARGGQ